MPICQVPSEAEQIHYPGFVIVALICATTCELAAQSLSGSGQIIRIKNVMTSAEFESCGLDRLSKQELNNLDIWLQSYTLSIAEILSGGITSSTPDVIESRIDGDFEGWDGETIFKLTNGQIWQQSSYDYTYHYAYRPEVLIYKTNGSYKMKVEGVDETIYVRRLK